MLKIRKNLQSCRDIFKAVWIICQIVAQVSYQIYRNTICRRFILGMNSIATQLIRVYIKLGWSSFCYIIRKAVYKTRKLFQSSLYEYKMGRLEFILLIKHFNLIVALYLYTYLFNIAHKMTMTIMPS